MNIKKSILRYRIRGRNIPEYRNILGGFKVKLLRKEVSFKSTTSLTRYTLENITAFSRGVFSSRLQPLGVLSGTHHVATARVITLATSWHLAAAERRAFW